MKKNSYTIEQMLDNSLKCTGGESFKEVEQRMNEVIENIIKHNNGKKVVIVSHGASIKYYLKKYCNFTNNKLFYNKKELIIESPSVLRLKFNDFKLKEIKQI
ncbi:MAG: histidine phosphatase family protein [Clostridiales bacterium]|nr:histidine phosphatase family protein [Clostridiales bacterium]